MDKSPPPYNEVFPSAPPMDQNSLQQNPLYPNVPVQQWNQQQISYPPTGYQQPLIPSHQPIIQSPPRPNVVIINQQVIFGENPIAMTCPSCQQQILTKVEHESNVINHSIAIALCMFGFCCCMCIPYCIDSIKDVTHKCSKCGSFLGKFRRGRV